MRLDLGENGSPAVDQESMPGAPQAAVARLVEAADAGLVQDFRYAGRDDRGIDHTQHFGRELLHLLGD